jgi:hypothetical protein
MNPNSAGQCVHVIWLDSSLQPGWVYEDRIPVPKEIESVGFICGIAPEAVQITCTRSKSGGVIAPLTIPICCIRDIRTIEVPPLEGMRNPREEADAWEEDE